MHDKLAVPIELPAPEKHLFLFHIANLDYDINHAREQFGPSPYQEFVDGLGEADYWAFTYPCGIKLAYEFIHPLAPNLRGYANVYGDLPEISHGVRHIPFSNNLIHPSSPETNKLEIEHFKTVDPWATKMASLASFQVWRQGDDGNKIRVGESTSKRDAECWVKELESHGHKQLYWYTVVVPTNQMD